MLFLLISVRNFKFMATKLFDFKGTYAFDYINNNRLAMDFMPEVQFAAEDGVGPVTQYADSLSNSPNVDEFNQKLC